MKAVEPLLLPGVGCPALDAIQKSAEDTGLVDTELGIYRQLAVLPDALAITAAALAILVLISVSRERELVIVEPR